MENPEKYDLGYIVSQSRRRSLIKNLPLVDVSLASLVDGIGLMSLGFLGLMILWLLVFSN